MKKVSVLGRGKTGGKVIELLNDHHAFRLSEVFHSQNAPLLKKMEEADALVVFVNGDVLENIMPILMRLDRPIVCGTTGFNYHPYAADLAQRKSAWLHGSNFSLGVHLMRKMLEEIRSGASLFDHLDLSIHEIHHTKKLDSPSGTSKSMASWLGPQLEKKTHITAERTGDVVGTHTLTLKTEFETLIVEHVAHDRLLFANGALKMLEMLLAHPPQQKFLSIEQYLDQTLFKKRAL
ncbi:MAG: dihydrodipicolinate reductase C-terminal domain-containing protein [Bacteriovoracaceae bacterium]